MNAAPENWQDCLEQVMASPGHKPDYHSLCADAHPQHERWRARMCAKLGVPSLVTQAANLAGAVGRVALAAVKGDAIRVSSDIHEARRRICLACEFHDAAKNRCTKCGCGGAKLELATEHCPLKPPKW